MNFDNFSNCCDWLLFILIEISVIFRSLTHHRFFPTKIMRNCITTDWFRIPISKQRWCVSKHIQLSDLSHQYILHPTSKKFGTHLSTTKDLFWLVVMQKNEADCEIGLTLCLSLHFPRFKFFYSRYNETQNKKNKWISYLC